MRAYIYIPILSLLTLLTGCSEDKIHSYEVAREAPEGWPADKNIQNPAEVPNNAPTHSPAAKPEPANTAQPAANSAMQPLPGMAQQASAFQTPEWTVPDAWKAQPLGPMRKGSWTVEQYGKSAEISALAFPGMVGGMLANINRWAGQVGAKPLTAEELATLKQKHTVDVDGSKGLFVELNGSAGKSIAGVIVPRVEGTWFFKMQGDTQVIRDQTENLRRFTSSVSFKK